MDLSRLNDSERRILRLLATGHTAKSAAIETGLSEAAVNERLREARRKTGASSSRELARALGLQETRDEISGVSDAAAPRAGKPVKPGRTRPGLIYGWIAMTAVTFAALFYLLAPTPEATPPRVVATSPAAGATVPAGKVTISVTFDRPMRANSYSFLQLDPATYPDCTRVPRQSADGRTFSLDCTLHGARTYAIGFNGGRFQNFRSVDGMAATPATLRFATAAP